MSRAGLPTVVGGVEFRSRTEARFAAVLTALGVPWRYEPGIVSVGYAVGELGVLPVEAFAEAGVDPADLGLRRAWYAPDFILTAWGVHVELKPTREVAAREMDRPVAFSRWPLPVVVWSWADEYGLMPTGPWPCLEPRGVWLVRCASCNEPALAALDDGAPPGPCACPLPTVADQRAWARAMALGRGARFT